MTFRLLVDAIFSRTSSSRSRINVGLSVSSLAVLAWLRMTNLQGPVLYETCEDLRIDYSIGMYPAIKQQSAALLQQAVDQYADTSRPQRLFTVFSYQAGSWPMPRWVVVKCEANSPETNRRAVVTNRPGAWIVPQGAYDEYAERGESENRNKELKCELCADRLSDHRYMANCFRMFLHCAAANLLIPMRRRIANPPLEPSTHVVIQTPQNNRAVSHDILSFSARVLNTTASVGALTSFEG